METLIPLFSGLVLVAAALAAISIWTPRRTPVRAAAVVVAALFIPVAYLAVTDLLSKPKPMAHEWFKRHVDEAEVLGVSLDEGNAIYLWLLLDGTPEPRFYRLPWRRGLAQRLQDLIDEAIEKNGRVMIDNPFAKRAWDDLGDLNVDIAPPSLPPQKLPPPPARIFNPRSDGLKGA